MHWGLTAFERKRIERIASDHPYFDMHAPLLTKKELRTILAQDPRKTGSQVVAEVKKELSIAYAPVTQEKRSFTDALRDASFVPSFRRTFVLSVFCLLLVLFMTLTVPGRAFAEEVYSIIVNYVNNALMARSTLSSTSQSSWDYLSLSDEIDSPTALAKELNCPIVITTDKLVNFRYTPIDANSLIIQTKYQDKNGKTYVLEQELYRDGFLWGYGSDYSDSPIQVQSSIDITMYGGISEDETNKLSGFTSTYWIRLASKQLSLSELTQIAERLHFVSLG